MVRTETIIAVKRVAESSIFYQRLLGCRSEHGGGTFEILKSGSHVVLCLHEWGEHEHPTMISPAKENGNGLILFFRVDDLNSVFENAKALQADIEREIHYNENSLKNQFTLRDLDGYYLIISE
jgi:catechol 2,3-dioxygenase-like lactoylglutathione lyase family enzyme